MQSKTRLCVPDSLLTLPTISASSSGEKVPTPRISSCSQINGEMSRKLFKLDSLLPPFRNHSSLSVFPRKQNTQAQHCSVVSSLVPPTYLPAPHTHPRTGTCNFSGKRAPSHAKSANTKKNMAVGTGSLASSKASSLGLNRQST